MWPALPGRIGQSTNIGVVSGGVGIGSFDVVTVYFFEGLFSLVLRLHPTVSSSFSDKRSKDRRDELRKVKASRSKGPYHYLSHKYP